MKENNHVTVRVPTPLRPYAGQQSSVGLTGRTVGEAMSNLAEQYPALRQHIFDDQGALRPFVNLYLNGRDIHEMEGVETPLAPDDKLTIIPAIAGGQGSTNEPSGNESDQLDQKEVRRYSRHLLLPEVGLEGQKRLKAASVLLVGAGGLGSPAALYLAAAGIGRIGLIDFDVVDDSNLQRQIIHGTLDVGRPKLQSARDRILDLNPNVEVVLYEKALDSSNALEILADYDVVIDGTDNFPTRYLINDACVLLGKANVYGSIYRFEGQASVFYAEEGPCYRCLFPEPPPPGMVPSCAEGGVLGVLPGVIGTIQATEAIKLILGVGQPLIGRLLLYDALDMSFDEVQLRKNPQCPVCGEHPAVTELIDYVQFCGLDPADMLEPSWEITPRALEEKLRNGSKVVLLDVRELNEWEIAHLEGALLIPQGDLPARMNELDSADEIVVYCRGGTRSARAVSLLRDAGFRRLKNLRGGINAWAQEVDPSMPQY
jgi:molybdopterin/thiamine biosynthesis adenylyltransferase/rhodanese-related sulfurtransferase/molybdopterin converting factor small subunit